MSAESSATGSLTSVPSASGTRIASACAPSSAMLSQKVAAGWAQAVCRPSRQNWQVLSDTENGETTRSPLLDGGHLGAGVLDDADELVAHAGGTVGGGHRARRGAGRCRRCRTR